MLKKIKIEEAVGLKLAHDITRIVPGKFKGAAFRKGHRVRPSDIPKLLDLGKKQVYVLELRSGELHENDAAKRMARAIAGKGLRLRGPREGKIDFLARAQGLLKINLAALDRINSVGSIIVSTRHNHSCIRPGEVVAGTRIIPLTIREAKVKKVEEICRRAGPVLEVLPFRSKKVGILVTGSEIFEGRIRDRSAGIVKQKVEAFGSRVIRETVVPDDALLIAKEICRMKSSGCQVIVATAGLSVDPDDVTVEGIRRSGAEIIFYGMPVLPGSMSLYARLGKTAILGAPACVVHDPATALDILLPPVLADSPILAEGIAHLGHGGLCLKCPVCRYPVCPFGKAG
ncbi:MAG TPA: molybdopterin-binding protein [Thermodesulfobacteriota bacterium]|nr:molybdopterin-binding protein [Thermodesulfobacteriota bacterium]